MIYVVGQKVRMLKSIGDKPCGDSPGGMCAAKGEILIVRRLTPNSEWYQVHLSHEDVTDGRTFGVTADEIEPIEGTIQ